ncbi:MAG: hypothetical protein HFI42_05460 [Lachnospiraceae bacterium]|nr:hypothetical protein [Lachnospiraceae bacterium]MCI9149936.1 hypothetical protein [Lachnospiraceae bacterium]
MRKTNSIRLIFVLGAVLCCGAYGGGYYYMQQQRQEPQPQAAEQILAEDENEIMESGTVVLPYEYILKEEDGFVAVYYADGETLYDNTAIVVEQLPGRLQAEIRAGKQISNETELYNFLENYSS